MKNKLNDLIHPKATAMLVWWQMTGKITRTTAKELMKTIIRESIEKIQKKS